MSTTGAKEDGWQVCVGGTRWNNSLRSDGEGVNPEGHSQNGGPTPCVEIESIHRMSHDWLSWGTPL